MKKLVVFALFIIMSTSFACAEGYDGIRGEVVCEGLSLRSEPTREATVITMLENNQEVIAFENGRGGAVCENGFMHVYDLTSQKEGWVIEDLVELRPRHLVVADNGTRAYASADRLSRPLTDELPVEAVYLILEEKPNYFVINFRSAAGYIRKNEANVYVKEDAEYHSYGSRRPATVYEETVAYSCPDTDSYPVALYEVGTRLKIVDRHDDAWYVVMIGERHAYVLRKDVEVE